MVKNTKKSLWIKLVILAVVVLAGLFFFLGQKQPVQQTVEKDIPVSL